MKKKKLKEKLHEYIDNAKGKQLKNILSMVEEDAEIYEVKKKNGHWNDRLSCYRNTTLPWTNIISHWRNARRQKSTIY